MRTRFLALGLSSLIIALGSVGHVAEPKAAPTFAKEGVAFLRKHCIHCHGEKTKKADLALHTFRDDASLVKQRKLWQAVLNAIKSGEMPPQTRPRPAAADIDSFTATVKAVFAHAERNARPDPGRVTIRRLNRTEYNSTIRDLVGVDFDPAADFPSDDIGHGFDNIGDVLTLSPVLMERYLAAAESIMQRAIVPNPPKPPVRAIAGVYLQPYLPNAPRWRPIDPAKGSMLSFPYGLTMDGEYTLRVRVHAENPDNEPARIVLKVDDVELKTFDVKANSKEKAVIFEASTNLKAGKERRGQVALLNPKTGDGKERKVYVEWMAMVGPADTRPESHRRLLATTAKTKPEQTREVLTRFASRAYRRPATKDEVDRLVALAERAEKAGERWEPAMQMVMQAVLVSPKFLFRLELDEARSDSSVKALDEYQLASRLSYFLWSSMPDQELLDLAAKKQLTANLDAQVRRMLKDQKAYALVENFALQWLQLRRLKSHAADPKLFPTYSEALRAAMLKETELFFWEIVREDRSVLDLIDGKFTYVNDLLTRHYGLVSKTPRGGKQGRGGRVGEFTRVELPDGDRGGVLTHASVLTVTSNPTRTSPVKRGKWVLEQLLGTPPPPPPPDVPELDSKRELTGTLRQQMEQHRKNPSCAGCHAKMDPLGFAFENYDAVGRYRKTDGKFSIDASGVLPDGKSFQGAKELKAILREKKDLVARCLAEKLLIYALGRGLEHYDTPAVEAAVAAMAKNEYRFSTLAVEIAKSFPFRMKRGKDTP